jgi:hypothetical protein
MIWFMLNIPLAVAFFGAWVGIPLWLVIKHPDTAPDHSEAHAYLAAKAAQAAAAEAAPAAEPALAA